jgi:hypothetical protein
MRRYIWGLLIGFFLLFSLAPTFYEIGRMNDLQPGRYFELVHNFYTDYNFYLSRIRQGREGANAVTEKYTSEPHKGSYVQVMYLLMGKVSAWSRVPWPRSGDTYHIARAVLAVVLLAAIASAAKSVFQRLRWQLTAFLLAVTASTWPILVYHKEEWRFGGYMPWWTVMDSLQRITFVPHMLAGQALIVILLIAMSSDTVMKRPGNWIFLGFIALLLGVVFPAGLLFIFAALGVFTVTDLLYRLPFKTKQEGIEWAMLRIAGPAVIGVMTLPSAIYFSLIMRVYPWKRIVDFALLHPQPFVLTDYILAVGPMLPLGILGAVLALWKKEAKMYIFVAWMLAWMIFIIAFQYIPQESPLRFTEMMPQVPQAVLATYLFIVLAVTGNKLLKNKKTTVLAMLVQIVALYLPVFLIILGVVQMQSSWSWQKEFIDHKIRATAPLVPTGSYVMYPLKDFVSAILFIQDNTTRDTVILSETTAGNYIPVYSGNAVYVGHANTIDTEKKESIVASFFSGRMGPAKAKTFLSANNLHYIFFGPQEMEDGGLSDLAAVYPFLKEIYRNDFVRIYQW